ncbi:MAG: replicative DNA helicase [Eubacteriales bacterium]|nr:replicative DNA helicase [Eubacteriales bacterium]
MPDNVPPHNVDAERSVLGAALVSRDAMADASEILKPEDFYDPKHQEMFSVMLEMFSKNKAIDIITVSEELKKQKKLEKAGGRAYIAEISGEVPSTSNAMEYAKIVAESSSLRQLIESADKIRKKCYDNSDPAQDIVDYAEKTVFAVAQSRQSRDFTPLSEVLLTDIDILNEAVKNQGQVTGLTTGFERLDEITAGFHKSDLVIVAARPAMGKTAFALNIAQNAALKAGAHVLIFSLEMSKEQLGQRMLAMEAKVDMENIKKGEIKRNDWERILNASDTLSGASIYIDDTSNLSVFEIRNKCRRLKAESGLDLVVIDYLQLMEGIGRADSRQQEISNLSRYLKLLAREMDCPIIVLSQLSRAPEQRPNHRPILSDLRESGAIEQDADIVIFLYRDDYYNEDSDKPGVCEVNLAKHRSGPTGTVELTWVARYTKFADKA